MSLINKMLQDLDARGGAREDGLQQQELKAVPAAEPDRRPWLLAGAGVGVAALVAAAVAGWYHWQSTRPVAGPIPQMVRAQPTPAAPPAAAPSAAAAALASAPETLATVAPAVPATMAPAAPATRSPAASATMAPAAPLEASRHTAETSRDTADTPRHAADTPAPAGASRPRARAAAAAVADDVAVPAPAARAAASAPAARPAGRSAEVVARQELTPKQMSENTYRRALASLQEGRVSTALADLDRALEIDPRNEAARQTYVSLLLENRRPDDAIRQLRLGLGIDPRQPGLAMVLARLQLERGGPALQTLMTTLPYAAASADYQAFLAGVLQREQRHAEAAQYYQAALKLAPFNGVWWMGLGISLQADRHVAEAREAFTRARTGNGMTPELLAFVERRLEQLAR
jgi:MSHA biogenesis protein MshN